MLSDKILRYRINCNLTQKELAEKIGVSRESIHKLENNYDTGKKLKTKVSMFLDSESHE